MRWKTNQTNKSSSFNTLTIQIRWLFLPEHHWHWRPVPNWTYIISKHDIHLLHSNVEYDNGSKNDDISALMSPTICDHVDYSLSLSLYFELKTQVWFHDFMDTINTMWKMNDDGELNWIEKQPQFFQCSNGNETKVMNA